MKQFNQAILEKLLFDTLRSISLCSTNYNHIRIVWEKWNWLAPVLSILSEKKATFLEGATEKKANFTNFIYLNVIFVGSLLFSMQ